jgi:hypothetical protein
LPRVGNPRAVSFLIIIGLVDLQKITIKVTATILDPFYEPGYIMRCVGKLTEEEFHV